MLHTLRPHFGATKKRKRIARGSSAGGGTTAGRGTKGQQSRAGKGRRFGFEGGQVPMIRRQPKLGGFINPNRREVEVINIDLLEAKLEAGAYTVTSLKERCLLTTNRPVKILGRGKVTKAFHLTVHAASKSAKQAITKAGGTVKIVASR